MTEPPVEPPCRARLARWFGTSLRAAVLRGVLAGLVLCLSFEAYDVLIGQNFHVVRPGAVYRAAQLSGPDLQALVAAHGIRTVICLRGCCLPMPWYLEQTRAVQRLGVAQEDLGFCASRFPSSVEMRHLIEVLDNSEPPLLVHCFRGSDRTGLCCAAALLLHTDATVAEARRQMSWRYGHIAFSKTGRLDDFLDLYERWLGEHQLPHRPELFRHFACFEYCPGPLRARLEWRDVNPTVLRVGQPALLHVRCHNTSIDTWQFLPGLGGIHLVGTLMGYPEPLPHCRAGLFEATVRPGEHIDLELAVPPLHVPGRYALVLDMVEGPDLAFCLFGSTPLRWELEVR
jgi:hypothetical protein